MELRADLCEVCAPLTQLWAEGASWKELGEATGLDEGSVVQLLRRTLDLLRQIPEAPGLSPDLAALALAAARSLDRPPVSDVL